MAVRREEALLVSLSVEEGLLALEGVETGPWVREAEGGTDSLMRRKGGHRSLGVVTEVEIELVPLLELQLILSQLNMGMTGFITGRDNQLEELSLAVALKLVREEDSSLQGEMDLTR